MRRHWITTSLAYLCFVTAAVEIYALCLIPLEPGGVNSAPLYTPIWRILALFPSSTSISWVANLFVGVAAPTLIRSKVYSGAINALTLVFSVVLGLAIFRLRPWARWVLVAICALTLTLNALTLYQDRKSVV